MLQSPDDPIDVITVFTEGKVEPLRFRWRGKVIRVGRVTGRWSRREGQTLLRYFAVESPTADSYELCYDPRGPRWMLTRAWTGGSHG